MFLRRMVLALISVAALSAPTRTGASEDDPWIAANLGRLVELYTHLHGHPELSFKEVQTAETIAKELRELGAEVTTGVGKLGVVGVLKNGPGKTVLVRSDLDALPVTESTGLSYSSKVTTKDDEGNTVGVMHACGHDMHMTCLVGVGRWLMDHKDRWSGTVVLIGQPAEERVGGAKEMLADGLYTRFPRPDAALALHVAHDLPAGKIGYRSGPTMASSTSVDLCVKGKGGHGAMPHSTVDPIVLAAAVILDLQTIVSREIKPIDPAVITVGSIHGGTKHNIIPGEVRLQLTLRAFNEEVRESLIEGIKRRASALATAHRAPAPVIDVSDFTPATVNTPSLVAQVLPSLKAALGEANVEEVEPTMGAEDFGLFGQGGVPTFMFRLGTISSERIAAAKGRNEPLPSLHSALYFPEPAPSIESGVKAMAAAVTGLLPPK